MILILVSVMNTFFKELSADDRLKGKLGLYSDGDASQDKCV